jgi:hypothetical protein
MLPFIGRRSKAKTRPQSSGNTGSSQPRNMMIPFGSFWVEGHVILLRSPDVMEQDG